ncbi:MAG: 5'/3'-nucleotidase SurE [Archangium sp.]|nr:5'/3'-nucleotidase SurE [Archangium sp.]
MRILISNDDGVFSPGIAALAKLATEFGEVRIVAPDFEQSSMGQAISPSRPLSYRRARIGPFEAFRVNGTPSDCVALGIHHWERVDVVLSGINQGLNVGNACWHSGTLAAAKQAALFGVRGIALSAPSIEESGDYDLLMPFARRVLTTLLTQKPMAQLHNVNFPLTPRGITWTKQSVRHYDGKIVPDKDPYDRLVYWFAALPIEGVEPGTDRWALGEDLVSITPLRLDLTDQQGLAEDSKRLKFD